MSRLTRARRALAVGLTLFTSASCAPTQVLEGADLPSLQALAAEVQPERIQNDIVSVAQRHNADVALDCTAQVAKRQFPELCHLTDLESRAWLKGQLESLGMTVSEEPLPGNDVPVVNLIAELPGTTRPDEVVLVGAHYDAFWQGADDNSSGVAGLLEMVRVLSQHRFERTIRFVGFDYEEFGIIGSIRYVQAHPNDQIDTALIFDCIGFYSDKDGSQQSLPGLPSPSRGDFLAVISNDESSAKASDVYSLSNQLQLLPTVPLIASGQGTSTLSEPLTRSDHVAFWFNHQKALFLTDTGNFRNPNYHKDSDTPDTLDTVRMGQAVRVATAAVAYWAQETQP